MAWNTKFKIASAAKREQAKPLVPKRFDDQVISQARSKSPQEFLARHYAGVVVSKNGAAISVDQVLRSDFVDDHWVSCDWFSDPIGDNLALVQYVLPGISFPDAVREITSLSVDPNPLFVVRTNQDVIQYPRLPIVSDIDKGRAYLTSRGLSQEVVQLAEQQSFLRYSSSGVLFLGRDLSLANKPVRSATIRYFEPLEFEGKLLSKRDFANSHKSFPCFICGDNSWIAIAESGISALAVWDIAHRAGVKHPTVISTGGVGSRRWLLENKTLTSAISGASVVEIWGENEKNSDTQTRTDDLRAKLQISIAEIRQGELPKIIYPSAEFKDAASWNLSIVSKIQSENMVSLK